jgi:hypothetical protein
MVSSQLGELYLAVLTSTKDINIPTPDFAIGNCAQNCDYRGAK